MGAESEVSRQVYGALGIPVDAMTMGDLVATVAAAKRTRKKVFISTPNLNFLILAQSDARFRQSVVESDLCPVDGIGVILVCKLLGIPVTDRVAGSDIPRAIASAFSEKTGGQVSFALFGGEQGVAEAAMSMINAARSNISCAGVIDPGRISAQNMVNPQHLKQINAWNADFLLVALGAQKGQEWITQNLPHLNVPVVSHLGATINFLAGNVKRAPGKVQKLGLEWLWRIKEEPRLARRYWEDITALLRLMLVDVLPLAAWIGSGRRKYRSRGFNFTATPKPGCLTVKLGGAALDDSFHELRRSISSADVPELVLDAEQLLCFDARFCGELLLAEKNCRERKATLKIVNANPSVAWALRRAKLNHLMVQ